MSTATVIVIAIVVALLLTMLVAGGRKAARARTRHLAPPEDRSHAEASRRGEF